MPEYIEASRIIETPRYIETPRMIEAPRMVIPPAVISDNPTSSSITIISDCTPAVCKNLANTIQLMIVCNLLQNTKTGGDLALQMATPILNEVLASPTISCGCGNPVLPNIATPYITPNYVSASIAPPNAVPSNMISPRVISPNAVSPNVITGCPNAPASNIQSTNGLLTSLMSLFGSGIQM